MTQICCRLPKPDYKEELTPEEFKGFCFLVNYYLKQKYSLSESQAKAHSEVLLGSIPFKA